MHRSLAVLESQQQGAIFEIKKCVSVDANITATLGVYIVSISDLSILGYKF